MSVFVKSIVFIIFFTLLPFSRSIAMSSLGYLPHSTKQLVDNDLIVEEKVNEIINKIIEPGMTQLEKEYAIFRYLQDNAIYVNDIPDAGSAYGLLVNGMGVCSGYTDAANILLQRVGIDTEIVIGTLGDTGHAWNIVKLGDGYYHLDTTNNRFNINDMEAINEGYGFNSYAQKCDSLLWGPTGYSFHVKDDWIYFMDANTICRVKPDGTDKKVIRKLPPDWYATLLKGSGECLYYSQRSNYCEIYKIKTDGTSNQLVAKFGENESLDDFFVKEGWMYCSMYNGNSKVLFRIKEGNQNRQNILECVNFRDVKVGLEWVYYKTGDSLYKVRLDGTENQLMMKVQY